jgi:hypothetical protein
MSQGRTLLAAIYSMSASTCGTFMELPPGGYEKAADTLRLLCGVPIVGNINYLELALDRFDAALALEYGDANSQSFPPAEQDRIERFQPFWGYTRAELETLVSTGNHPDI